MRLILTMCVGTLRQPLEMDAHVLLVGQVAGVNREVVNRIAVIVTFDN